MNNASYFRQFPYKTTIVVSQHIWSSFSTLPLFNLGSILMETFATMIRGDTHFFRNKSK